MPVILTLSGSRSSTTSTAPWRINVRCKLTHIDQDRFIFFHRSGAPPLLKVIEDCTISTIKTSVRNLVPAYTTNVDRDVKHPTDDGAYFLEPRYPAPSVYSLLTGIDVLLRVPGGDPVDLLDNFPSVDVSQLRRFTVRIEINTAP